MAKFAFALMLAAAALLSCASGTRSLLEITASAKFDKYCTGGPCLDDNGKVICTPTQNLRPINTAEPKFVRAVSNGKLYSAGQVGHEFPVVHLFCANKTDESCAYKMGYAHGSLLKDQISQFYSGAWEYLLNTSGIPPAQLPGLLDQTAAATKPFTPQRYFEEMHGVADGAGTDYQTILRVHMLAELTKGHCSMFGAWGSATPDGSLVQLRALDWDTGGPFIDHPAVIVYHKSDQGDDPLAAINTFANVGFTGWVGAITGVSEKPMAISEIGVSNPDKSFQTEHTAGQPFPFMLREILQYDTSVDAAVARLSTTNRTCNLILGVGDGQPAASALPFRGFQSSGSVLNVFDDKNMTPHNDSWHQRITDVVYWGMDWLCPAWSLSLGNSLRRNHGNVTAEVAVRDMVSLAQTGNLHIAVYDFSARRMLVSFHANSTTTTAGDLMAFERQFTALDLRALFSAA